MTEEDALAIIGTICELLGKQLDMQTIQPAYHRALRKVEELRQSEYWLDRNQ
jgi:hypothetical protein